jgi:hypothetical protein
MVVLVFDSRVGLFVFFFTFYLALISHHKVSLSLHYYSSDEIVDTRKYKSFFYFRAYLPFLKQLKEEGTHTHETFIQLIDTNSSSFC